MQYKHFLVPVVLALGLLAPAVALAQTTEGKIMVYVQVINRDALTRTPGDFSVLVTGSNPSPASFPGSVNGTTVSLSTGAYAVSVGNTLGYSASYSQGCSGTMTSGG